MIALACGAAAQDFTPGWTPRHASRTDSTQTYSLYLPPNYSPERKWPLLLVFDPRGRSMLAAQRFTAAAERHGWIIVSSDNTVSDGPWEPNARALRALWPEVHTRFAVDPRRIYAAGFSGGAIVAWYLAQFGAPPLAGIIACGGRPADEIPTAAIRFAHFGAAGETDFNHSEMRSLDSLVAAHGMPHQFRVFAGGHAWMPEDLAAEAVEWMEVLAMRTRLRPVDEAVVQSAFARHRERAAALVKDGNELEALRCQEFIAATFDRLHDLAAVHDARRALGASPTVAAQREAERRAGEFELEARARLAKPLARLEQGVSYEQWEEIADEMDLRDLKRRAHGESAGAQAMRRVLAWAFGRTSFYIPRMWTEKQQLLQAATSTRIAAEIRPEDAAVWHRLAVELGGAGKHDEACAALLRAVETGQVDWTEFENTESLRDALSRRPCAGAIAKARAVPRR
jgi:predicted esterase